MVTTLSFAIENKHLVGLTYKEYSRIVEPYMVGLHRNGQQVLYCYQISGESYNGEEGWREFFLYKIYDLKAGAKRFNTIRKEYQAHKWNLNVIYCEIKHKSHE